MVSHIKSERLIFLITDTNAQFDDYAKFGNDEKSSLCPAPLDFRRDVDSPTTPTAHPDSLRDRADAPP